MRLVLPATIVALVWVAAGHAQTPLRSTVYASGFSLPVAFVQDPTDRTVQFVVEQRGRIRVVRSGAVLSQDFLDLTGSLSTGPEQGLLGLALAPGYATTGRVFVNFTDTAGNTVVARFRRSANPLVADLASRFDLRWGGPGGDAFIVQPFINHNGGNLVFGPDGFLYVGLGDGGSGGDPDDHAQNPAELLGKMLRIDVGVPDGDPVGYQIPSDNPFVAGPAGTRPEIWSFGLRNPWRYSFDDPLRRGTGALIIGDVGQNMWEEVDYEPPNRGGRNYGWRNREGAHVFDPSHPPAFLPLRDPIYEYDHSIGNSITGGRIYRGCGLGPTNQGRYFFGDYVAGRVWSMGLAIDPTGEAQETDVVEHTAALGGSAVLGNVSSFGVDAAGELYIVNYSAGKIVKVLSDGHPGAPVDFDCDGKSDRTVFRPSTGGWFTASSGGGATSTGWGVAGDVDVAGDYDGDGRADIAVWRPSSGAWFILQSSTNTVRVVVWGTTGDIPLVADVDGDGKADLVVFRPSTGAWFINKSTGGATAIGFGTTGDQPLLADYDGDGKADLTVFRPSTGAWFIHKSGGGGTAVGFGTTGDVPVTGDWDGDGLADLAVFRPSTGQWFVSESSGGSLVVSWGGTSDVPVGGDVDGDGKSDFTIWRPSTGAWFTQFANGGSAAVGFGSPGDKPVGRVPGS